MITIESEIFTELANALRAVYEDIFISGEYVMAPSKFPSVSIEESDNYTAVNELDTGEDRHAVVMYEINVYTNKTVGKKTQAKDILAIIDGLLTGKNFTRVSSIPVPNIDNSIYRITARYRAETDGTSVYRYTL